MLFMAEAAENKLEVTKPLGDSAHYDFAVEHQGKFARVQVKSTVAKCGRGYGCTVRGSQGPYGRNAFDYLAVYLILEEMWYIIPAKNIRGQWAVCLYPNLSNAKYEPYREAWHLLSGKSAKSGRVRSIQACAVEVRTLNRCNREDYSGEYCNCSSASAGLAVAVNAVIPYSSPFSKAFRFSSRKLAGTESATALPTASASSRFVTAVKNPTMTEFSTMRFPSTSAMRVAGMLKT